MAVSMITEPTTLQQTALPTMPHLLVIDDDPINRELMRRLFDSDYTMTCVGSGRAGLEVIAQKEIDVVLLDIMMPDMNGFQVLEHIRGNPDSAELPVILISSLTDSDSVVQGLQLGANDYLTKPINLHVARARLGTQVKVKRLLDERKHAIAELERLNELREHFFRIASHDLRNPLANLRLATHELTYYVPDDKDITDVQDTISVTFGEIEGLLNNFLDVAALRSQQIDVARECVDLKEVLWHVSNQFQRRAAEKDINLYMPQVSGYVIADAQRLVQIIGNLVSNAIKFSPAGSTVTLWTETAGDRTRIFVGDEGPGMTQDDQDKLFKEFSKAATRPTAGERSTGLGLWIVKHLMQLLDGCVGVSSAPGEGSIFWVELPALSMDINSLNGIR